MTPRFNLDAGELRQRVAIEVDTTTDNTRGNKKRTWATMVVSGKPLSAVACKIETPAGRKLELARQLVPSATHTITMRYRVLDVNANRLNCRGRIFYIGHQEDVEERHVKLILTCTEQLSGG
jgi:SPP1 family predicted phage head-tail adaptor